MDPDKVVEQLAFTSPLNFKMSGFTDLVNELEDGLGTLISALNVAQKFTQFLPGEIDGTLKTAIKILAGLKVALEKIPE